MMSKLGVGVIGLRRGSTYLSAFNANPNAEIRGVCDLEAELLNAAKKQYNARIASMDYKELFSEEIDVIAVCTPDHFHKEQSVNSLHAGKHVLCEKPLAIDIAQCEEIVKAVDETGLKFMVGQNYRFESTYWSIKKLVEEGKLGDPFFVEVYYWNNLQGLGGVGNWRNDPSIRHILRGGCHAPDLARWIIGEVVEVFAYSNLKVLIDEAKSDDFITTVAKFSNGCIGNIIVSSGCQRPFSTTVSVYGSQGTVENNHALWWNKGQSQPEAVPRIEAINSAHFVANHFVECILEDKTPMVDVRDGARTIAVVEAAIQSAKEGKPVKVKTDF
ncbi:Gfo/Idh/MocA family oxidoreductase [Candidatus Poribacteria bacterium]|nr:Gfo/Idh/MocA family oxidoreductase [Candidatus Poribacteria bacterium]